MLAEDEKSFRFKIRNIININQCSNNENIINISLFLLIHLRCLNSDILDKRICFDSDFGFEFFWNILRTVLNHFLTPMESYQPIFLLRLVKNTCFFALKCIGLLQYLFISHLIDYFMSKLSNFILNYKRASQFFSLHFYHYYQQLKVNTLLTIWTQICLQQSMHG